MRLLRRLICLLVGHRAGHALFRYDYCAKTRDINQWPGRSYGIAACGFECARCGAKVTA
jgi:hypothetical protein